MKRAKTGNTADILEAVWMNEGISRIELAKRLEIDKSTVSNIVGDLIERNLLDEYDQALASSLGGRKPVKLRLNKDFGYVTGIEIQPDQYRLVVVNLKGEKVFSLTEQVTTDGGQFEERFHRILDELRQRESLYLDRCLGVGLALSGIVNPFAGIIIESTSIGMRNVQVLPKLSQRLRFPVFLENDANAACWGEVVLQQNIQQTLQSFLFCLIEFRNRGQTQVEAGGAVGLGFVVNGQIHYGENFSAGEFKSLGWKPGNTFQFSLDDGEMARLKTDKALLSRFARELASHILFVSRVFNLNHVYFGGEVDLLRDDLVTVMEEERRRYWPEGDSPCRVNFSTHGPDAVAFGAACLGLTNFFRDSDSMERLAALRVFS
jgi:predicted NBD/HSP70 family sugar kinase